MGEETHVHHFQGYVEMHQPVRFTHFKLPEAHFFICNGTREENIAYCTKEDTRIGGPYTFGKDPKPGERNDLIDLRNAVKSGKRGADLFDDDDIAPVAIKYQRGVEAMVQAYTVPPKRDKVEVTFHYGKAGTGKTYCADCPGAYFFDGGANNFWNGYKVLSKITIFLFDR